MYFFICQELQVVKKLGLPCDMIRQKLEKFKESQKGKNSPMLEKLFEVCKFVFLFFLNSCGFSTGKFTHKLANLLTTLSVSAQKTSLFFSSHCLEPMTNTKMSLKQVLFTFLCSPIPEYNVFISIQMSQNLFLHIISPCLHCKSCEYEYATHNQPAICQAFRIVGLHTSVPIQFQ